MSTENVKLGINGKRIELKLTTQYADHIMDHYIHKNPPHDLTFSEIANVCRKCKFVSTRGRIFAGTAPYNGKMYRVFGIVNSNFFILKTCFYYEYC
jgi:hypothetical protein